MDDDAPELSVILPCFNEEGALPPLVREIGAALRPLGRAYEILVVDDASTDATAAVAQELGREDAAVRVLQHVRNCGQSAAVATGFRGARGAVVITLDSDGQNDPNDIPRLLDALAEHDVVCGVRARRHDSWVRKISSRIGNGFRNVVTGDRVRDAGCALRAMHRDVTLELPVFNGLHRFLPTLARYQGFRVAEIDVNHRPRRAGVSKYGIGNRAFRGILDCFAMRWWRRRALPGRRARELARTSGARA